MSDSAELPVAAGAGRAHARRGDRGAVRDRPRRTHQPAGARRRARSGPVSPGPRFALAMVGFLARPTEHTRDRFLGECIVDLEGVHDQMGEDWESIATYGLDGAREPRARRPLVAAS